MHATGVTVGAHRTMPPLKVKEEVLPGLQAVDKRLSLIEGYIGTGGAAAGAGGPGAAAAGVSSSTAAALAAPPPDPSPPAEEKQVTSSAWQRFAGSSVASLVAETATLPMDVSKTRLQCALPGQYSGLLDCIRQTAKADGVGAFWKGLEPALVRQVCYSSLAMVLFEPIRDVLVTKGQEPNFVQRLMAGGSAGALSICVFNPTEVVKTQMMTASSSGGGAAAPTMSGIVRTILAKNGVLGLWAGLGPNVARTFLVNAAELGTYDQAKASLEPLVGCVLCSATRAARCLS
eukprot:SAG22_NODE_2943_length_2087_cov_1.084507_1_plen_289_part_00